MMVRCLEAGGLVAVFDPTNDESMNLPFGGTGYIPNPNGFYTGHDEWVDWPTFYEDHKGKVTKIFRLSLHLTPPGKYKLLFMVRDPQEILASMRAFSPFQDWGHMEVAIHFYNQVKNATLDRIKARGDYEILEVNYADVVKNPTKAFQTIQDFGFPIDVQQASVMVDPTLHRFHLEQK